MPGRMWCQLRGRVCSLLFCIKPFMNRMLCKNPFTILLDQLKFTGQRQHAGIETFRILGAQPLNQYDAVRCVIIGLSGISEFCIGSTFAGAVVGKAEAVKIADKYSLEAV